MGRLRVNLELLRLMEQIQRGSISIVLRAIQGTAEDGTFNIDHWSVQAVNYLDDYGTFNGAAALETVITLGNWKDDHRLSKSLSRGNSGSNR